MRASGAGADAVASFYRAAAVALSEARAPGDVLDTLTLVRGVALRDDEDDASRGASRRAGEASPPPVEGSLAALAAAARRSDPAFAWSGFEPCGEEMCHAVVATWLPCLTAAQRASLHDEILRASPPAIAARVLVPALAPSRNPSGRRLDHVGQLAVAAEAARALARALDRGLAADIVASAATSVSADDSDDSADDARDALRALLSAADRCELPPGAHPDARRLHPRVFARDVAEQILRAGAEAARAAERSTTTTDSRADDSASFAKDSTAAAAADVAAFAVGVACRRGDADAVADALIALLLDAPSTKETDPPGLQTFWRRFLRPGPGDAVDLYLRGLTTSPDRVSVSSRTRCGAGSRRARRRASVRRRRSRVLASGAGRGAPAERCVRGKRLRGFGRVRRRDARSATDCYSDAPRRATSSQPSSASPSSRLPNRHIARRRPRPRTSTRPRRRDVDFGRAPVVDARGDGGRVVGSRVDSRGERRASRTRRERGGGGVGGDGTERVASRRRRGGAGSRLGWRRGGVDAGRERAVGLAGRADATPRTEGGHRARRRGGSVAAAHVPRRRGFRRRRRRRTTSTVSERPS